MSHALANSTEHHRREFFRAARKETLSIWDSEGVIGGHELEKQVKGNHEKLERFLVRSVRLAGLLHDYGHLPFSHQSEAAVTPCLEQILGSEYKDYYESRMNFEVKYHEYMTLKLIDQIPDDTLAKPYRVIARALLSGDLASSPALAALAALFGRDIDIDRFEYTLRDCAHMGKDLGGYDFDTIAHDATIRRLPGKRFALVAKDIALGQVERFVYERYFLYKWVYRHPDVKIFDVAIERVLSLIVSHADEIELKQEDEEEVRRLLHDLPKRFRASNFLENPHFDDIWMLGQLRRLYYGIIKKPRLKTVTSLVRALLEVMLDRRGLASPLYKGDIQFYQFSRDAQSHFTRQVASSKEILGAFASRDRACFLNSIRGLIHFPSLIERLEQTLTDALLSRGLPAYVVVVPLPPFRVYKGDAFLMETTTPDQKTKLEDLKDISPFCRMLDDTQRRDAGVFLYAVFSDPPTEEYEAEWKKIAPAVLGEQLGQLCEKLPPLAYVMAESVIEKD